MNRRSFLMKLGAGMIGALVVRPSLSAPTPIFKPTEAQLNFFYGGGAGGGKSIVMHPNTAKVYRDLLGIPYHESNASTGTWLGITRSQESFFRSER